MKMIVESMMECRLARETEVLGENLHQRHFCLSQNPTCPPGFEPGPPGGKPATNRLSYGAALTHTYMVLLSNAETEQQLTIIRKTDI
jgi:hypothetical protein